MLGNSLASRLTRLTILGNLAGALLTFVYCGGMFAGVGARVAPWVSDQSRSEIRKEGITSNMGFANR